MILYIANRGEIALRVLRTAKRLGIRTVVGYANQDKDLPFVEEANKAIPLQGEEVQDTYLNLKKVIQAAKKGEATHLHPGYGFFSENVDFAENIEASGIKFVGPASKTIRLLGDKIGSRHFLKKWHIPFLPSYEGNDQSENGLLKEAKKIGIPLLIKPSAGGGGKGMALVNNLSKFKQALISAKRLALAHFKDDRVLLEKWIEPARHIEVQVLADADGHIFILGERECSLQRHHQKIMEESPCIFLPEEIRQKIIESSELIAKKSGYISLGTVEWLWDGKEKIYFLEVNSRLQVEHPVTELVWNVDLVEQQLRIAEGECLKGLKINPHGHAVEARICAEDPAQNFMPSCGKIHRLTLPQNIRVDFGYKEKNTVPAQFDSMLGKFIAWGKNREEALIKLEESLKEFVCFGPTTNRSYLIQLLQDSRVQKGELSTHLLSVMPSKARPSMAPSEEDSDYYSPWGSPLLCKEGEGGGRNFSFFYEDFEGVRYYHTQEADWKVEQRRFISSSKTQEELSDLKSPLPGKVIKVFIQKNKRVKKGEVLLVIEAMKMEHQIKAAQNAVVDKVLVREGDRVQMDALILTWKK